MIRMFFVIISVAFFGSLCFAVEPAAKPDEIKTFTGKIDSITRTVSRSTSGPYCKIIVVADNGEKATFFVLGTTRVSDTAGKDMSVGGKTQGGLWLKKNERVEIKYSIIKNGSSVTDEQNEAVSIRCLD